MAVAARVPAIIRSAGKQKIKFTCTTCFREVEGWEYLVGMDVFNKRPECSVCWAQPRIPPMKPVGFGVILG